MPRRSEERWTCALTECGQEFIRYRSQLATPERPFCAAACAHRFYSLQRFPMTDRLEAAKRYMEGEHTGILSSFYGINSETMRTALKELGICLDRRRSGAASWSRRNGILPDEGDLTTGFRWCKSCGKRKPMDDYYWRNSSASKNRTRVRKCKPCAYKEGKNGAKLRTNRRKYLYNLTEEKFKSLWSSQNGLCAICQTFLTDDAKGVHVDHCHSTKVVRGLLCSPCNTGLGHFRDNPEFLRLAARYLESR